jgi:hypothetical protein
VSAWLDNKILVAKGWKAIKKSEQFKAFKEGGGSHEIYSELMDHERLGRRGYYILIGHGNLLRNNKHAVTMHDSEMPIRTFVSL